MWACKLACIISFEALLVSAQPAAALLVSPRNLMKILQSLQLFSEGWGDLHPGSCLKVWLVITATAADGTARFFHAFVLLLDLSPGSPATETQLIWDFTAIHRRHAPAPYPLDACDWAGAKPVCLQRICYVKVCQASHIKGINLSPAQPALLCCGVCESKWRDKLQM